MTKVEAIEKVMLDNGGVASLSVIYDNICKYYPLAKESKDWEAGLRGVLYREILNNRRFKKIGLSIYSLIDYKTEDTPKSSDNIRMHSYIEGICIELGNFNNNLTYTADPSALYRDNVQLKNIATMNEMPLFSYEGIVNEVKRIDVVWFNKKGYIFPKNVFEIVDSIGTLDGAFKRCIQLHNFNTKFCIVAPEKHHDKFFQTIDLELYRPYRDRFGFINYDEIQELYDTTYRKNKLESKLFIL
ncbi:MAG: hypothetical protein E7067_05225 [Lentimicrobiaceae bacterium]|nr:hypothetical protein [Lentimicrobiaceae bacterium]